MGKKTKRRSTKIKVCNGISDTSNPSLLAENSSPRAVESGRVDSDDIKDRQGKIEGAINIEKMESLKLDTSSGLLEFLDSGGREAVDYLMLIFRVVTEDYGDNQALRCKLICMICKAMSENLIDHEPNGIAGCRNTSTPEDKKFLRDIIRNKNNKEPIYIVALATVTLAEIVFFVEYNRADCLHLCQECLQLWNGLSEEEKCQSLPFIQGGCTVGEYLIPAIETADFFLKMIEYEAEMLLSKDERKALLPGGKCEGCGVVRKEGQNPFKVCSRCNRSYYCSKECQLSDWNCHKKDCRKSGDFRVGDKVILKETFFSFIILAEVDDKGNSDDRYWLLQSLKGDRTKAIIHPSAKLRMMQPSELLFFEAVQESSAKGITPDQAKEFYMKAKVAAGKHVDNK